MGGAQLLSLTAKFKLEEAQRESAKLGQTGCCTSNCPALKWEEESPLGGGMDRLTDTPSSSVGCACSSASLYSRGGNQLHL